MTITATMILAVCMIATGIIAFIKVHTHACCMATVQLAEYIFTIPIATLDACTVKNMLQLLTNGCTAHSLPCITASNGDTMAARLLCCR
jgi:hypothetical protein